VLRHGIAGAALVCSFKGVPGFEKVSARPSGKTAPARRQELTGPFEPFKVDLPLPRELPPVVETRELVRYEIEMRERIAEVLPGFQTPIAGYDGTFPGPTLRARRERATEVHQVNRHGDHRTVHLHGGVVIESSDGALPSYHIPAGGERTYHYPNRQRAATLWYHDHSHGHTSENLYHGLAGFYLVEDERERELRLPHGRYDVPLMIVDRSFNADGSLRYVPNLEHGFLGDTILVNGAVAPRMQVRRRLYRLRFLNASNARVYQLELGNRRPMHQIAGDAGLLPRPRKRREIPLTPGERVEVLVDFRRYRPGTQLVLRNADGERSTTAVMRFDVEGGGGEERARVPRRLRPVEKVPPPVTERRLELDLGETSPEQGGVQWQINGKGFDPDRVDCRTRLGTTEIWHFANPSEHAHPMHLHLAHFRILSENGRPPHPGDSGWKDVVNVRAGETVTVQPFFRGFPGRYVFHCHTLEHGDNSMMSLMEVVT
jgi:spore coat protein A